MFKPRRWLLLGGHACRGEGTRTGDSCEKCAQSSHWDHTGIAGKRNIVRKWLRQDMAGCLSRNVSTAWNGKCLSICDLSPLWKTVLSKKMKTALFDAKGFAAWCLINHLPIVQWVLGCFFCLRSCSVTWRVLLWTSDSVSTDQVSSSLCFSCLRFQLLSSLWISLLTLCFLETCLLWKVKLQGKLFPRELPQPLETICHFTQWLCHKKTSLLAALQVTWTAIKMKGTIMLLEINRMPQNQGFWISSLTAGSQAYPDIKDREAVLGNSWFSMCLTEIVPVLPSFCIEFTPPTLKAWAWMSFQLFFAALDLSLERVGFVEGICCILFDKASELQATGQQFEKTVSCSGCVWGKERNVSICVLIFQFTSASC